VFVIIKDERLVEGVQWLEIGPGWMPALDAAGNISYTETLTINSSSYGVGNYIIYSSST
jgi:hypothetical protein